MTGCEVCGKDVLMPFECNFCGGSFCEEHRLPENHNCKGAPPRTPLGSYQSKQRTATEKKGRRGMVSEGDFHFKREAGMLKDVGDILGRIVVLVSDDSICNWNCLASSQSILHFCCKRCYFRLGA
jgi:hypothetical protein